MGIRFNWRNADRIGLYDSIRNLVLNFA